MRHLFRRSFCAGKAWLKTITYINARAVGVIRWSHMDELFSSILRFLGYVVSELLLGTVFYAIGWPFVKIATLGKYPKREWLSGSKNEAYVCCVGILVFSILLMAVLGQFSA